MEEEKNDDFNDRVDKIFGSISKSSSSSSCLWSLTDAQIERKVWNRNSHQIPLSSSFNNTNTNEDDCSIRSCIGLDPTLDNEDEEDAFDKMAQGTDSINDDDHRLYMNDHGPFLNSHNLLQPPLSNNTLHPTTPDHHNITIKSILKRKTTHHHHVPAPKRVTFHPTCNNHHQPSTPLLPKLSPQNNLDRTLPDYILNPSKYTRYDFHHHHDPSDRDIYSGFLDQLTNSKHVATQSSAVLPKSLVFIPNKKPPPVCNTVKQQPSTIGIAALEVQQQQQGDTGEIDDMQQQQEEESRVCHKPKFQRPGRRYRSKMEEDDNLC